MADPGGLRPPGPEPGRKIWLDFKGQSVSEVLGGQGVGKSLFGADSEKLKMRRLPPAVCPRKSEFEFVSECPAPGVAGGRMTKCKTNQATEGSSPRTGLINPQVLRLGLPGCTAIPCEPLFMRLLARADAVGKPSSLDENIYETGSSA